MDDRVSGSDLYQEGGTVFWQVAVDPVRVVHAEAAAGHDVETVGRKARDREVGLDAAILVAELGVDYRSFGLVHVGDGEALDRVQGAGAELGRAHVCTPVTNAHL